MCKLHWVASKVYMNPKCQLHWVASGAHVNFGSDPVQFTLQQTSEKLSPLLVFTFVSIKPCQNILCKR